MVEGGSDVCWFEVSVAFDVELLFGVDLESVVTALKEGEVWEAEDIAIGEDEDVVNFAAEVDLWIEDVVAGLTAEADLRMNEDVVIFFATEESGQGGRNLDFRTLI